MIPGISRAVLFLGSRGEDRDAYGDLGSRSIPIDRGVVTRGLQHRPERNENRGDAAHVQFVALEELHGGSPSLGYLRNREVG